MRPEAGSNMRSFDMLGLVLSHGIIILFSDVLRNRMVLYLCIKDRIGPGKAGNGVLEIPISIISFGGGMPLDSPRSSNLRHSCSPLCCTRHVSAC